MTIKEGEETFGKPRSQWTKEEQRQFVSAMDASNMQDPLCLSLACDHMDVAPPAVVAEMYRISLGYPKEGF